MTDGLQEALAERCAELLDETNRALQIRDSWDSHLGLGPGEQIIAGDHEERHLLELLQNARDAIYRGQLEQGDVPGRVLVVVPEQGGGGLIPPGQPNPGVVLTIGVDRDHDRHAIFRVETQALKGRGRTRITGAPSRAMKDAVKTGWIYLRGHSRRLGIAKDPNECEFHVKIVILLQSKEGSDMGVSFFVAMLSALLEKPVLEQLMVLGEISIHGSLLKVPALAERLQLAMDNGAKHVLILWENKRDFADVPSDVLGKLQIIFYADPVNAAFRAMGLE